MIVVIILPDGVGVRNFLLGPFPQLAAARWNLCVLHTVPDDFLATYAPLVDGTVQWRPLVSYRDTAASYLLRAATSYAHLYWADTFAMRRKRNAPVRGSWGMRFVHHLARVAGRLAASPLGMRALDRWHQASVAKRPEVAEYRELFERVRPSVLLCSHQRPTVVLPAVLAARALDIPTATCIFSWDNLTSKGRIAAPFDYYLVWSEHMRREFRRYYPAISPERVHVVGTPQFDPYADRGLLWERSAFFGRIHADPARPLICYSGGDVGTTPDDPQHVRILMELIRAGAIPQEAQVVLRPAPGDPGDRFQGVCRDHPKLIFAPPAWVHTRPGDWTRVLPLPDDVRFLANLTHHSDLNINVASTMTLDFAIHDKPVVNIAFDVTSPPPHGRPLWDVFYQYEHYRPVLELGAARIARSPAELAEHVTAYLACPSLDRAARRRLVELELSVPPGESGRAILSVLDRIAG